MVIVYKTLGSRVLPRELDDIWLQITAQSDPCEDAIHEKSFPLLANELEPMPEVVDVLLPIGDQIARGRIVAWRYDANGNVMGRPYKPNP